MPIGQHTDPKIQTEILTKIRDEGMLVTEAAATYNVNPTTIYG
jgi:hypothetical protein